MSCQGYSAAPSKGCVFGRGEGGGKVGRTKLLCSLSLSPIPRPSCTPPPLPPQPQRRLFRVPPRPPVLHRAARSNAQGVRAAVQGSPHGPPPPLPPRRAAPLWWVHPRAAGSRKGTHVASKAGRKPAGGLTRRPTHCKVDSRVSRPLHSPSTGSK